MAVDALLSYGDAVFLASKNGYETLKHSAAYEWAEVPLLNRPPAYQYTGPGAESVTIDGVLFSDLTDIEAEEALLRGYAQSGAPAFLISAIGEVLGRWFIESLDFETSTLNPDGTAKLKPFTISLKRYD